MKKLIYLLVLISIISLSCTTVKEYQKVYLNDKNMELNSKSEERFELTFELYREGASGANGGKSGGGCGCN